MKTKEADGMMYFALLSQVNLLSQVHHPNLVELLGYHTSHEKQNPVQMLVYEYMPGGTLMDHLYGMPLIINTFLYSFSGLLWSRILLFSSWKPLENVLLSP
jgi:serine/threonine protein kinase